MMEWMAKNAKSTTASVSMSMSMTTETKSPEIPESVKKMALALEAEKKKINTGLKIGFGKIALGTARLFRGTQLALCVDPDLVPKEIY